MVQVPYNNDSQSDWQSWPNTTTGTDVTYSPPVIKDRPSHVVCPNCLEFLEKGKGLT